MSAVAIILKGYPRLSETFIAQELLELERRGLDLRLISLRRPTDNQIHPMHREIAAPVRYLPEYLHREPVRVLCAVAAARRYRGFDRAREVWLRDLRRDPTRNRIRRFGQACVLARELDEDVGHLHAHFLHTPASVTRYTALIRDLSWSCSAHAKDIWTSPDWEIREKLAEVRWVVTCTAAGLSRLHALARHPGRVDLVYHGLDFSRFPAYRGDRPVHDGSDPQNPVVILSVGRAVEKKGYEDLLRALAALGPGLAWRFRHIGGGAGIAALQALSESLGIAGRVNWLGPRTQDTVLEEMRRADIFALASKIAADGDRDGLPNVLMEAQSQGLAVLSTRVSAIPELIVDRRTGLLCDPGDPETLARALTRLILDPALRHRLGQAGATRVRERFSLSVNVDAIADRFGVATEARRLAACE